MTANPMRRYANKRATALLIVVAITGCSTHPQPKWPHVENQSAMQSIDATDVHAAPAQEVANPQPFVYQPPTTTPYDSDPLRREQYLKAHHAGWNMRLVIDADATCCFAIMPVTEGYYAGQQAADRLFVHSDSPAFAAQREKTIERIKAEPEIGWYIRDEKLFR